MTDSHMTEAISRRAFLAGCMAAGVVGCTTAQTARKGALDPNAIGVISDIHTGLPWGKQQYRTGMEYPWMPAAAKRLVAEILALQASERTEGSIQVKQARANNTKP